MVMHVLQTTLVNSAHCISVFLKMGELTKEAWVFLHTAISATMSRPGKVAPQMSARKPSCTISAVKKYATSGFLLGRASRKPRTSKHTRRHGSSSVDVMLESIHPLTEKTRMLYVNN
ncbi:uncharacterized protein BT62DRAFT_129919 [Guyanagaster necrorhizus]|uniref:Uncharacterized protein n=1 Tax=Guyanagaster necrorhizus TaxID=856835 RepID=A0A9P7VU47_9AGAR|nr:uncharacterized protein BT62DRAFT_129919 [Guyanagaster necrorhizus MCA 3950]KAG7446622.1 hypothetical protein BT62DRAFT_129919 [Guyanagaster necrorhizus MCA 3950]